MGLIEVASQQTKKNVTRVSSERIKYKPVSG
jgi:hypothetical protein